MVIWKKNDAEQQRQEALMMRIAENGGVEKLDTLEIRDIPEAITLCKLLNSRMENSSMTCLENFLRKMYADGGK
jgi:hypothetical protein